MTETRGESAAGRAESFTPAERAVMAARAEAEQLRAERNIAEQQVLDLMGEVRGVREELYRANARAAEALDTLELARRERDFAQAESAEARARLADLARQATAAGPVLEAAEEWFDAGAELVGVWHLNETFHLTPDEERALMAAEARDRAAYDGLCAAVTALRAAQGESK